MASDFERPATERQTHEKVRCSRRPPTACESGFPGFGTHDRTWLAIGRRSWKIDVQVLTSARRLVVKVGSALLIDAETGAVNRVWLAALAADLARLKALGAGTLIVSSGAVALGRRRLGLSARRKLSLAEKQAAAAAGQSQLMRAWEEAFEPHGSSVAQILLTRGDTEERRRWLNARSTVETLLRLGVVPVVNENDTVATEEIRYGDNDRLAARVAQMIGADALVLLSDIDGLYTADPRRDPTAQHLSRVPVITAEIEAMAGGSNAAAGVGVGGMASKLAAARIAQSAGCATVIAHGRAGGGFAGGDLGPLSALEAGARCTLVDPLASPMAAYKQWIAGSLAPGGVLAIDAGAAKALRAGKSLLPSGVDRVEGGFDKGDTVRILGPDGFEIARGVVAYSAREASAIRGLHTGDIAASVGYEGPSVLVHRDDLVLTEALDAFPSAKM
jgi:glutamate 5-kinase